jgi:tetratricopeptide (TPR) repeat protein
MNDFYGLFRKGIELFEAELYWEAIDCFKTITSLHPEEPLLDDVYVNIAVCYMHLNLFEEAHEWFVPVYEQKVGDGRFEDGGNNVGTTRARAALGLIRISLAQENMDKAESFLLELENDKSGFVSEDGITTFLEVAQDEMALFEKKY